MLKRLFTISFAIVLALIPVYTAYQLNKKQPDVQFTLSAGIPLSFLSTAGQSPETVQQLDIKNIGNSPAEKIVVKLPKKVTSSEILKHSASDSVQEFKKNNFEVVYSNLPPGTAFSVIFKAPIALQVADISVTHNAGLGKEALQESRWTSADILALAVLCLSTLLMTGMYSYLIYDFFVVRHNNFLKSVPLEEIFAQTRPWYLTEARFYSNLKGDVQRKLDDQRLYHKDLSESSAYKLANIEIPSECDAVVWEELNSNAMERLYTQAESKAGSVIESEVISFLRVNKPERFPIERWEELRDIANQKFLICRKQRTFGKPSLMKELSSSRPGEISPAIWEELMSDFRGRYCDQLELEIKLSDSPLQVLEQEDLTLLKQKHKERLLDYAQERFVHNAVTALIRGEKIALERPSGIDDFFWFRVVNIGEALEKIEKLDERQRDFNERKLLYNNLRLKLNLSDSPLQVLDNEDLNQLKQQEIEQLEKYSQERFVNNAVSALIRGEKIALEKPSGIDALIWFRVVNIGEALDKIEKLDKRERDLRTREESVSNDVGDLERVRAKVTRQLILINEVLKNPSAIDRIESHDDTFASGNWQNLRKVAELMKAQ